MEKSLKTSTPTVQIKNISSAPEGSMLGPHSPRSKITTQAIRLVQNRSPRITVTYNRGMHMPVGSVSPETFNRLGVPKTNKLYSSTVSVTHTNIVPPVAQKESISQLGNAAVLLQNKAATQSLQLTNNPNDFSSRSQSRQTSVAIPIAGSSTQNAAITAGVSPSVGRDTQKTKARRGVSGDDFGFQHSSKRNSNSGNQQPDRGPVPRQTRLPSFMKTMLKNAEDESKEKKPVFTGSISDLLASQKLEDVFESFRDHELEFETYLRPIMQEVIKESDVLESNEGGRSWEGTETWSFLQKSIVRGNKVCTDIIQNDQRDRYMSKISKLREQQMQLQKDAEKQRSIEEAKIQERKRKEEEASRIFKSQLKKRGMSTYSGQSRQSKDMRSRSRTMMQDQSTQQAALKQMNNEIELRESSLSKQNATNAGSRGTLSRVVSDSDIVYKDAREPKSSNRLDKNVPLTTDLETANIEKRPVLSNLGATRKSSGSQNQHMYRGAKVLDDLVLSPVRELRSPEIHNDNNSQSKQNKPAQKSTRSNNNQDQDEQQLSQIIKQELPNLQRIKTKPDYQTNLHIVIDGDSGHQKKNELNGSGLKITRSRAINTPVLGQGRDINKVDGGSQAAAGASVVSADGSGSSICAPDVDDYYNYQQDQSDKMRSKGAKDKFVTTNNIKQNIGVIEMEIDSSNALFGNSAQDINQDLKGQFLSKQTTNSPRKYRIPGLSQEYPIKKSAHPPEVYSFQPKTILYQPESDLKKRKIAQKILKETKRQDKNPQLADMLRTRYPAGQLANQIPNIAQTNNFNDEQPQMWSQRSVGNEDILQFVKRNHNQKEQQTADGQSIQHQDLLQDIEKERLLKLQKDKSSQQEYFAALEVSNDLSSKKFNASYMSVKYYKPADYQDNNQDQRLIMATSTKDPRKTFNASIDSYTGDDSIFKHMNDNSIESTGLQNDSKAFEVKHRLDMYGELTPRKKQKNMRTKSMIQQQKHAPKIDSYKQKQIEMQKDQQTIMSENFETAKLNKSTPANKRFKQLYTNRNQDRFKLPTINYEGYETRRTTSKLEQLNKKNVFLNLQSPLKRLGTSLGLLSQRQKQDIGQQNNHQSTGMLTNQKQTLNSSMIALTQRRRRPNEEQTILETRLKQRGISMGDFNHNNTPWPGHEDLYYRTERTELNADALMQAKTEFRQKIIPDHITLQKHQKVTQLNNQYLDMVRSNHMKKTYTSAIEANTAVSVNTPDLMSPIAGFKKAKALGSNDSETAKHQYKGQNYKQILEWKPLFHEQRHWK